MQPNNMTLARNLLSVARGLSSSSHPVRFCTTVTSQLETVCTGTADENDKLYKKLEIELRGHDKMVLKSYVDFTVMTAEHLDIEVGERYTPRKEYELERHTLLRSAFVHKKHRVQYEFRTYYKFVNFHRLTGSTLSTFLEYIERNLPEGVALKTTKVELLELPQHLKDPPKVEDQ